jgi:hypothetical protein
MEKGGDDIEKTIREHSPAGACIITFAFAFGFTR